MSRSLPLSKLLRWQLIAAVVIDPTFYYFLSTVQVSSQFSLAGLLNIYCFGVASLLVVKNLLYDSYVSRLITTLLTTISSGGQHGLRGPSLFIKLSAATASMRGQAIGRATSRGYLTPGSPSAGTWESGLVYRSGVSNRLPSSR